MWRWFVSGLCFVACTSSTDGLNDPLLDPVALPRIALDPLALDFGRVWIEDARSLDVKVTHLGGAAGALRFDFGPLAEDCMRRPDAHFCVVPPPNLSLSGGETRTFQVRFRPRQSGALSSQIQLSACDHPTCAATLDVVGYGLQDGLRCAERLDLGAIPPGQCSQRSLRCTNLTNADLQITDLIAADPFSVAEPPASIGPDTSFEIEVTYCPDEAIVHGGALIARYAVLGRTSEVTVRLEGSGVAAELEGCAPLAFGPTALATERQLSCTLRNRGRASVLVENITSSNDAWSARPTTFEIEAGGSETLVVTFSPLLEGAAEAELLIQNTDPLRPELRVQVSGEGVLLPPCRVTAPTELDFGYLELGRELTLPLRIQNSEREPCLLYQVSPVSEPWRLEQAPQVIGGNATENVWLRFRPGRGVHQAQLTIDLAGSRLPVLLRGEGGEAVSRLGPQHVEFGTIGPGCDPQERRVLTYGWTQAESRRLTVASGAPFSAQLQGADLVFRLLPNTPVGQHYGVAWLEVDRPQRPARIAILLSAQVSAGPAQMEVTLPTAPPIDVLFVMDTSPGLFDDRAMFAPALQTFVDGLARYNFDYRIAATVIGDSFTPGEGELLPLGDRPVILRPGDAAAPLAMLLSSLPEDGPGAERTLSAAERALASPQLENRSADFYRPNSRLVIVPFTDEDDATSDPVAAIVERLRGARSLAWEQELRITPLAGPLPSGCDGPGGRADRAARLGEAAARTGSLIGPICSLDWADTALSLADELGRPRSLFPLPSQPVPGSLQVRIDGRLVTPTETPYGLLLAGVNGPDNGQTVSIEYTPECL